MSKKKQPINRLNKFFSYDDFDLDLSMGEEWLHGDINFDLVLFRVDRSKTVDDVYGESGKGEIKFLPPTEFKGMVLIGAPDNKTYSNGLGRYLEPGNMTISVYKHHLEEKGIDAFPIMIEMAIFTSKHFFDYLGLTYTKEARGVMIKNKKEYIADLIKKYKIFKKKVVL